MDYNKRIIDYIKLQLGEEFKVNENIDCTICRFYVRSLKVEITRANQYKILEFKGKPKLRNAVLKEIKQKNNSGKEYLIVESKTSKISERITFEGHGDVVNNYKELADGFIMLLNIISYADIEGLTDRKNPAYKDKIAEDEGKYYSAARAFKALLDRDLGHIIFGYYRSILYDNALECGKSEELEKMEAELVIKMEEELKNEFDQKSHTKITNKYKKKKKENTHREHVVPCVLIRDHITDMIEENRDKDIEEKSLLKEIAALIERNLVVINITTGQAKKLDKDYGLKTTMPAGWEGWKNGNIYARLDKAEIAYELYAEK